VTTEEYLYDTEEANRIRELAMGVVREPPSPFYSHQSVVLKIARLVADHADARHLGRVAVAPMDVVLDRERALILQPDVLFIATERLGIIRNQVWGAPDLVVEVMSPGSAAYDRGEKLAWYRQYGVQECWLVDLDHEQVTVMDYTAGLPSERIARGTDSVRSSVLPDLHISASDAFS
jgi:Uma2 family endonuclease